MTRPRVLHVVYGLAFGGVETQMRLIAETSGRYDHEFCAINWGGPARDAILAAGRTVHVLDCDGWRRPLRTVRRVRRLMKKIRPDVVHCHGAEANLFGLIAAWLAGVPVRIGEEIGIPKHSRRAKLAYTAVFRLAHRIIGVADAVVDHLVSSGEVPRGKAVRVYNPAYFPNQRASARKDGERFRIAYVGRLSPEKNPAGLIRAVLTLIDRGRDCELVLFGDGPERDELEQIADRSRNRVQLRGYVERPFDELAQRHLFVQPSFSEGLSLALVEAMSMALPAVSSGAGGSREVIEHGRTGWIMPNANADTIATMIEQAADLPPAELAAIGLAARESVRDRFSIETHMAAIEALYDQVRENVR